MYVHTLIIFLLVAINKLKAVRKSLYERKLAILTPLPIWVEQVINFKHFQGSDNIS